MTNEKENKVSWDEALDEGKFVKLAKDVRVKIVITNVRLVKEMAKFSDTEAEKEAIIFKADVVNYKDKPCDPVKEFSMTSQKFFGIMKQMGVIADGGPAVYSFSIKKLGEGKKTTYDVEDFKVLG